MTRTLIVALITLGDPHTLIGGYLGHRRTAALMGVFSARSSIFASPFFCSSSVRAAGITKGMTSNSYTTTSLGSAYPTPPYSSRDAVG